MRLYELAKELGIANKELVERVRSLGIDVKNHMSNLDTDDVTRVKRSLEKDRTANLVEERLSSTVIRRRTKDGTPMRPVVVPAPTPAVAPIVRTPAREPMRAEITAAPAMPQFERASTGRIVGGEARSERPRVDPTERIERIGRHDDEPVAAPPVAKREPVAAEPALSVEAEGPVVERKPEPTPAASLSQPGDRSVRQLETVVVTNDPSKAEAPRFGPTGRVIELPKYEIQQRFGQRPDPRNPTQRPGQREITTVSSDRLAQRPAFGARPGQPNRGVSNSRFGHQGAGGSPGSSLRGRGSNRPTQITTPAQHKRVVKMDDNLSVIELAKQMGIKATDVLKKLWSMGMTGIMLNHSIDQDTASIVASEFGFEVESTKFVEKTILDTIVDKPEDLQVRAPVVTIMGHVDHGKTSLLDAIRDADVAAGESGGITQHIGAYRVKTEAGQEVVFLDTPGHEAFTAMRARGAKVTDVVILVVAADDGVMQTTIEALNHAKDAKVPIIVAVNKIDKAGAAPDRVRQQLSDHGLIPEAWGGSTIYVDVSARQKTGIDTLLAMIALQAEVLELRANANKPAQGTIVEARLDRNRGPMATVLIQQGTLRVGDMVVSGEHIGKVKAMLDDKGRSLTEAGPSTPVEVLGLSGVPEAGDLFNVVADDSQAKEVVENRRDQRRKRELAGNQKFSLENIFENIKKGEVKELKVVLKADVQGSSEALKSALLALSTPAVRVEVISSGVGGITESDVNLAHAGKAIIVGFHVRPAGKAAQLAEQEGVDIKLYEIIYEALDDVKKAMAGMLAPIRREKPLGKIEVRQIFTIPKIGVIGGSYVLEGQVKRSSMVRVVRAGVTLHTGKLGSLRRFKDDVREVMAGYECGVGVDGFNDLREGDIVEAFEIEEIAPTL